MGKGPKSKPPREQSPSGHRRSKFARISRRRESVCKVLPLEGLQSLGLIRKAKCDQSLGLIRKAEIGSDFLKSMKF